MAYALIFMSIRPPLRNSMGMFIHMELTATHMRITLTRIITGKLLIKWNPRFITIPLPFI